MKARAGLEEENVVSCSEYNASSGEISKSNAVLTNHYEDRDVVDDRGTL